MTREQLHEHCEMLQQALIDLIAAVVDLQATPEREHLQVVLEAAMRLVEEEVPPLRAAGASEATSGGCSQRPPP